MSEGYLKRDLKFGVMDGWMDRQTVICIICLIEY